MISEALILIIFPDDCFTVGCFEIHYLFLAQGGKGQAQDLLQKLSNQVVRRDGQLPNTTRIKKIWQMVLQK